MGFWSAAAPALIGTGADLLFGGDDDSVQPAVPSRTSKIPGLFGQMLAYTGQQSFPLFQQYLQEGAPELDTESLQFDTAAFGQDTQDIFSQMEDLMNPYRERDRENLEARLYRQGRLGSKGGAFDQQSLENAIEESRSRNLLSAMDTAYGRQDAMFNRNLETQNNQFNRWLSGLSTMGNIGQGLFSTLAPYNLTAGVPDIDFSSSNPFDFTNPELQNKSILDAIRDTQAWYNRTN